MDTVDQHMRVTVEQLDAVAQGIADKCAAKANTYTKEETRALLADHVWSAEDEAMLERSVSTGNAEVIGSYEAGESWRSFATGLNTRLGGLVKGTENYVAYSWNELNQMDSTKYLLRWSANGKLWEDCALNDPDWRIAKVYEIISGGTLLVGTARVATGATNATIYRYAAIYSEDDGKTWDFFELQNQNVAPGTCHMAYDEVTGRWYIAEPTGTATESPGLYTSADGKTWSYRANAFAATRLAEYTTMTIKFLRRMFGRFCLCMAGYDGNKVVSATIYTYSHFYYSTDMETWTPADTFATSTYAINFVPLNAFDEGIYREDGLACVLNGSAAAGPNHWIYYTTDGTHWRVKEDAFGSQNLAWATMIRFDDVYYAFTNDGAKCYKAADPLNAWEEETDTQRPFHVNFGKCPLAQPLYDEDNERYLVRVAASNHNYQNILVSESQDIMRYELFRNDGTPTPITQYATGTYFGTGLVSLTIYLPNRPRFLVIRYGESYQSPAYRAELILPDGENTGVLMTNTSTAILCDVERTESGAWRLTSRNTRTDWVPWTMNENNREYRYFMLS